ncbi:barstar family protein [Allobranchiibius sp. CTAmp26]|uniref:barstar family protein n=1 Tax=Allobranchiibius sp. CTAmp26 TaxID=2815214 RepID=UPI001AA13F2A|nr:barstar family protein [Allobranchiibius sp. CTAmp26]MBO1756908.1 barstar family protein [Allobranchiibius sp. CTAmp26]
MKVQPHLHPLLLEGDAQSIGDAVSGWVESGLTARVVRGRKMRTVRGVLDEFAAALQFPLYFGENTNAFNECIADLDTLAAGEGYVVTMMEPEQVLADEDTAALKWLARALVSAAEQWAQPVDLGEWWDRPAVPFHVVMAGERGQLESAAGRWSSAGVTPLPFGGSDGG